MTLVYQYNMSDEKVLQYECDKFLIAMSMHWMVRVKIHMYNVFIYCSVWKCSFWSFSFGIDKMS